MSSDLIQSYAGAFHAVAAAEGMLVVVEEELFRFGQALEANDALLSALSDPSVPVARRQQVVEDELPGDPVEGEQREQRVAEGDEEAAARAQEH